MVGGRGGQLKSREKRSQSWQEWLGPLSQDSMRELGKLGWQRKWQRGIPEKGTKKREKSVGFKTDQEVVELCLLSGFPSISLPPTLDFGSPRTSGVHPVEEEEEVG